MNRSLLFVMVSLLGCGSSPPDHMIKTHEDVAKEMPSISKVDPVDSITPQTMDALSHSEMASMVDGGSTPSPDTGATSVNPDGTVAQMDGAVAALDVRPAPDSATPSDLNGKIAVILDPYVLVDTMYGRQRLTSAMVAHDVPVGTMVMFDMSPRTCSQGGFTVISQGSKFGKRYSAPCDNDFSCNQTVYPGVMSPYCVMR